MKYIKNIQNILGKVKDKYLTKPMSDDDIIKGIINKIDNEVVEELFNL